MRSGPEDQTVCINLQQILGFYHWRSGVSRKLKAIGILDITPLINRI